MAVKGKSVIAAQVEAERAAARREAEVLARRLRGEDESPFVRRGLTRTTDDDAAASTERTILEMLHAQRAELAALRAEVEQLREALAARP
jgi:hypothetical protein